MMKVDFLVVGAAELIAVDFAVDFGEDSAVTSTNFSEFVVFAAILSFSAIEVDDVPVVFVVFVLLPIVVVRFVVAAAANLQSYLALVVVVVVGLRMSQLEVVDQMHYHPMSSNHVPQALQE